MTLSNGHSDKPVMSLTPTAWLLAQIAADEAAAQAASPGPWHANPESDEVLAVDDITVCDAFALSGPQLRATTTHIATHDPARVLAQCAAFRAIVELHEPGGGAWCTSACESESPAGCGTLRALAGIFADRDGWQEAWR